MMKFEEKLGIKILDAYKRSIFGKVSKLELDLIVFGYLVKESSKDVHELNQDGYFNWFRIGASHIRQLSFQLQITEARVSNLLEQAALLELKEDQSNLLITDEVLFLLQNTRQSIRDINQGKIKLYIPNKITKAAVISYLAHNKSIPDLSFSQNVMTIRLIDSLPENGNIKLIQALENIALEANNTDKSKELRSLLDKLNEKSGLEKNQHLA